MNKDISTEPIDRGVDLNIKDKESLYRKRTTVNGITRKHNIPGSTNPYDTPVALLKKKLYVLQSESLELL